MPSPRRLLVLLLAVALGVALGADRLPLPGGLAEDEARVVRVVDGDTIQVELAGRTERVRYIGVDTPETRRPGTPVQCFGKRASARNARLVAGQRVRLVADEEPRDRYGRMLAYVYRTSDGTFVNAALVEGGYARTLVVEPNDAHAEEFAALARRAASAGRGLWGSCGREASG